MSLRGRIFTGVAFAALAAIIIVMAFSTRKSQPKPKNPLDDLFRPQTGQSQAPDSVDQKLSDIWGPNAKSTGSSSRVPSACPPSLPSGVSSKSLPRDQVSNLIGWEGSLYSWEEFDDNARPFLKWKALFGYKNNTDSCITSAIVEVDLDHNGTVSRERHSVVFDPILGPQESRALDSKINIRTPEGSEDVALTSWRIVGVSGFSFGPPPAKDANGFEIIKDPKDPFAAYGGHLIRVTIPASVAVSRLLQKTQPIYPPIAKAAGVSGTVILKAIISMDGTIEKLDVVSGPPMLQQAALDAVKTWKYKPFPVDGMPAEVETTVNIIFTLSD